MLGDTKSLAGRSFASYSNNVAKLSYLGEGGLRATWLRPESQADRDELNAWVASILDSNIFSHVAKTDGDESEAYRAFRKKFNG